MHLMPGGPVYESTDLVHWTLASYLFDRLSDSPLYDLHGGTSYGRGQWATSLKYHDGTFYALFCTNDPQGGADSYVNTLSQRMEGPECSATVCIDFAKMRDGDRAGFAAFNGHSGVLVISRNDGQTTLAMQNQTVNLSDASQPDNRHAVVGVDVDEKERVNLKGKRVYLRIDADFRLNSDIATFQYSADGRRWHAIGQPFQMRFDHTRLFMGTRYAIFNYATRQSGGYIDIDYFAYTKR